MPIYEYYCPQCQEKFEEVRTVEQRHSARCPRCNSECKKVMSRFSFSFFNKFTVDGEGFTSRDVPDGELAEIRQDYGN